MTKEMQTLALVPQGSLEAYIRAANAYPMLTAEEERELAERLHYQGDLGAAKTAYPVSPALCCSCCPQLFRVRFATS